MATFFCPCCSKEIKTQEAIDKTAVECPTCKVPVTLHYAVKQLIAAGNLFHNRRRVWLEGKGKNEPQAEYKKRMQAVQDGIFDALHLIHRFERGDLTKELMKQGFDLVPLFKWMHFLEDNFFGPDGDKAESLWPDVMAPLKVLKLKLRPDDDDADEPVIIPKATGADDLADGHQSILLAIRELSGDKKPTGDDIATQAGYGRDHAGVLLADLGRRGLVNSTPGRRGGYSLTPAGEEAIAK